MQRVLKTVCFMLIYSLSAYSMASGSYHQDKIDTFFDNLKQSPESAVDELFSDSDWVKNNQSQLLTVKATVNALEPSIGRYHGYDELLTRELADRYIMKIFLVRYELKPLFVKFEFYRPAERWKVSNFGIKDDIEELFEKSTELGLLKEIIGDSRSSGEGLK